MGGCYIAKSITCYRTNSYNAFSDASGSGTNKQVNVPTSIFVNYAGGNFRLASETSAGMALSAPFNIDLLGVKRGIDGTVSLGAFEFVANSGTRLNPPQNLVVR